MLFGGWIDGAGLIGVVLPQNKRRMGEAPHNRSRVPDIRRRNPSFKCKILKDSSFGLCWEIARDGEFIYGYVL